MVKSHKENNNKIDFNNMCGIMRSSSNKPSNVKELTGSKTPIKIKSKNIYYVEDRTKDEDPNLFIIDPITVAKHQHRRREMLHNKSLEDFRQHKLLNEMAAGNYYDASNDNAVWSRNAGRNYNGSRTLPRDFLMRAQYVRPSLDNLLDNYYNRRITEEQQNIQRCVFKKYVL